MLCLHTFLHAHSTDVKKKHVWNSTPSQNTFGMYVIVYDKMTQHCLNMYEHLDDGHDGIMSVRNIYLGTFAQSPVGCNDLSLQHICFTCSSFVVVVVMSPMGVT